MSLTKNLPAGKTWKILFAIQFVAVIVIAFLETRKSFNVHYALFTKMGEFLFSGRNPYGVIYDFGELRKAGLPCYSPVCGWFLGLFNFLPRSVGMFLFIFLSHVVLVVGVTLFLSLFPRQNLTNKFLSWMLILISGELFGAYQSTKIEPWLVGVLLISTYYFYRRPWLAGALGAMLFNFKLFPGAPVGLLAVVALRKRNWNFLSSLTLFFIFWFALPFLVYPTDLAVQMHADWYRSLKGLTGEHLIYASIYGFLHQTLGIDFTMPMSHLNNILLGIVCSIFVYRKADIRYAIAVGSLYVVTFNQVSQWNAFMVGTPAVIYVLYAVFYETDFYRKFFLAGLVEYWFLVTYSHSDLMPKVYRFWFQHHSFKALGSAVLLGFLLALFRRNELPAQS